MYSMPQELYTLFKSYMHCVILLFHFMLYFTLV